MACRILVLQSGIEPMPLEVEEVLTTEPPERYPSDSFLKQTKHTQSIGE